MFANIARDKGLRLREGLRWGSSGEVVQISTKLCTRGAGQHMDTSICGKQRIGAGASDMFPNAALFWRKYHRGGCKHVAPVRNHFLPLQYRIRLDNTQRCVCKCCTSQRVSQTPKRKFDLLRLSTGGKPKPERRAVSPCAFGGL